MGGVCKQCTLYNIRIRLGGQQLGVPKINFHIKNLTLVKFFLDFLREFASAFYKELTSVFLGNSHMVF